jgi:putative effector of murein hydrolase LrgA (UPF0299 family)
MLRTHLVLFGCLATRGVVPQVSTIPLYELIIGMILLLAASLTRGALWGSSLGPVC